MLSEASIHQLSLDFGARVRAARKRAGLTPHALASIVGLSRSSIANIEAGRQRIPIHTIWNLANALNVPVAELVPEPTPSEPMPKPQVSRFLKQERGLDQMSRVSRLRVREFVETKLAEIANTPSPREG